LTTDLQKRHNDSSPSEDMSCQPQSQRVWWKVIVVQSTCQTVTHCGPAECETSLGS